MANIDELLKQFANSIGYKGDYTNAKEFYSEFLEWLKVRQNILGDYVCLLQELGLNFMSESVAEVGKTCFDSAVIPFESKIITPYADKYYKNIELLNYENIESFNLDKRLIKGNFFVSNQGFNIATYDDEIQPNLLSLYDVDTFITHNPYKESDVKNWEDLHNTGDYNIVLGVFGSTYEKDRNKKINLLRNIKNSLINDNFIENYCIFDDEYFYVIGSDDRKVEFVRASSKCS